MAAPNYTLGRGKLYFSRFQPATQVPSFWRYMGNSPEFNLTIESETLEHTNSDAGINEVDDSVPLKVTRTGSLVVDDIQAENVALFFFGTVDVLTTVSAAGQTENFAGVLKGMFYQIGITPTNPVGIRGVTAVTVTSNPPGTTYVLGTDYRLDADRGMIEIIDTGSIPAASDIIVNYGVAASSQERILSGSEPVEGAMRYLENNPRGIDRDMFLPFVKITPNGDLSLKGDEWRQIPFSLEALKPTQAEAIYINGKPVI
jgi:hypothetical protein